LNNLEKLKGKREKKRKREKKEKRTLSSDPDFEIRRRAGRHDD
jgi:hypothetical protein